MYISNVYQMIHPAELTDEIANSDMAPALQIGRMDVPAENDAEWNEWYSGVYVSPTTRGSPDVFGGAAGKP